MNDVFQDTLGWYQKNKWYYWDESGLEQGPYNSEEQAQAALTAYIKYELNWEENTPIRKMREDRD